MFHALKQRFADIRTIDRLCRAAEARALEDGQREPAAEHFLLAALDLPDGSARRAFASAGADPDDLKAAVAAQYDDALDKVGIDLGGLAPPLAEPVAATARPGPYLAAPSGQALMRRLADDHGSGRRAPLGGAHVVAVAAEAPHGVVARALRVMGVDRDKLRQAALREAGEGR